MKFLKLFRTLQEGWQNFYRDGWLTFATVLVITLALYILSVTLVVGGGTYLALQKVQDRVTISVYFDFDVSEEKMLGAKREVEKFQEIEAVEYISRGAALTSFRDIVEDDPVITQALDELDENPLNASLVIRARNPQDYALITEYFQKNYASDVNRINYEQNKETIDRLSNIIAFVRNIGAVLATIFISIAILITFNTVRMSMYAHRTEFEIMRLVGASNLYVRMPSVFEGIFYGLAGALASFLLFAITLVAIRPILTSIFSLDASVLTQYALLGFVGTLLVGFLLGLFSSFVAIRRYLER